jgi:hypothetical protein
VALLAVLRLERGDAPIAARAAATGARGRHPIRSDRCSPRAFSATRRGRLAQAESLYTLAIARMPRRSGSAIADLAPLMAGADGDALAELAPAEHADADAPVLERERSRSHDDT